MANPNYLDRIKNIRAQNIRARAGKGLIFNEDQMLDLLSKNKVPTQMQHCIVKVYTKVTGSSKERFLSAFNICGAVFGKHGYQKYNTTILTSKGLANNLRHRREKNASLKESAYDSLAGEWKGDISRLESSKAKKAQQEYDAWKAEQDKKKKKPEAKNVIKPTSTPKRVK